MNERLLTRCLAALVLMGILGQGALANEKRVDREREALRRAQQQAQQMQKEKSDLENKLAAIEQEKASLSSDRHKFSAQVGVAQQKLKDEQSKREQLQAALDAALAEKASLTTQLQESTQRLTELGGKLARSDRDLQQTLSDKQRMQMVLAQRDKTLAAYLEDNRQLYQAGRDVIAQCKDQSTTSAFLRLEPVTGIQLVEIENRLERQRDTLDAHKIIPEQ